MAAIVSVEQMQAIERAAAARGHSYAAMMQHAGRAVADRVRHLLAGHPAPRIAIIVGPGNNGGDGLVAARILKEELTSATVGAFLLKPRAEDDTIFTAAREAGVFIADAANDAEMGYRVLHNLVTNADVVVDALFGFGVRLPIRGEAAEVLKQVQQALNQRRASESARSYTTPADPPAPRGRGPLVVAVDCPSGLDCDTGDLDSHALTADETVTLAAAKPGLLTFPGAQAVGTLHIGSIGLPARLPERDAIRLTLVEAADVARRLPARPLDSHKGTFGKALIVGGTDRYTGALHLAASAAYRSGAGLVTVAAPQGMILTLAGMLAEATWLPLPHAVDLVDDPPIISPAALTALRDEWAAYDALLIGPGLGRAAPTGDFLRALFAPASASQPPRRIGFGPAASDDAPAPALPPLVLDADALNLLAEMPDWPDALPANTVITPHPAEFGRLAELDTGAVQADRVALAQAKAAEWQCVVVLKGAFTVIAAPDGPTAVQPFATPALASAGTGDVLAGLITGLIAQGLAPFDAALAGGWLHGMAGVCAARRVNTAASVMAGDVLAALPEAITRAEAMLS